MKKSPILEPSDLHQLLGNNGVKLFDCRFFLNEPDKGRREYAVSHIPTSQYVHLDNDLSDDIIPGKTGRHPWPNRTKMEAKYSEWGIEPSDVLIAYDQSHGGLAARFWGVSKWMGMENVFVLNGGWKAWNSAGYEITKEIPKVLPSNFKAGDPLLTLVDMSAVAQAIDNKRTTLIDARASARYRGEQEPIDPIAGHIPSAVNLPFIDNVDDQHKWLEREELQSKLEKVLGSVYDPQNTILYCGSGVTACHDALTFVHLGLDLPLLYPGSWSEWITNKENPIATGDGTS